MQDRRTPPLADMAKPEAKLAEMVKEECKPAAEANGAMPHPKLESQQAAAQVLVHPQAMTRAAVNHHLTDSSSRVGMFCARDLKPSLGRTAAPGPCQAGLYEHGMP